jgi:1,4-alpha-glucan branching enzyme
VGEFNDWNETARPMRKQKDGSYSITQDLSVGRPYQFRYLTDAGEWINDDAADDYAGNEFGVDNSVVKV